MDADQDRVRPSLGEAVEISQRLRHQAHLAMIEARRLRGGIEEGRQWRQTTARAAASTIELNHHQAVAAFDAVLVRRLRRRTKQLPARRRRDDGLDRQPAPDA